MLLTREKIKTLEHARDILAREKYTMTAKNVNSVINDLYKLLLNIGGDEQ